MSDMEEGEIKQRRAAVAEILGQALARLAIKGHSGAEIPPSQNPQESLLSPPNCLAEGARSSRHVSLMGNVSDLKTLPENGLHGALRRGVRGTPSPSGGE